MALLAPIRAEAVTTVQVSVISATPIKVKYQQCKDVKVQATGDWGGEDFGNMADLTITDESGNWVSFDATFDTVGSTVLVGRVCADEDESGTYTATVEVSGYDLETGSTEATGSDTFKVKATPPATSKITRTFKRQGGRYPWVVFGTLHRLGKAYVGKRVRIEAKIYGEWTHIESMRTRKQGRFGWEFKPNPFVFRYVFDGDNKTIESYSTPFRVPPGSRSGRNTDRGLHLASLVTPSA